MGANTRNPQRATVRPERAEDRPGSDTTRSLLLCGMAAGPAQLLFSLAQVSWGGPDASAPPANPFVASGEGWAQALVVLVCGVLAIGGAVGLARALRGRASQRSASVSVAVYGACVLLSGVWAVDPVAAPLPGATEAAAPALDALVRTALGWAAPVALTRAVLGGSGWLRSTGRGGAVLYSWSCALVAVVCGAVALTVPAAAAAAAWLSALVLWTWLAAFFAQVLWEPSEARPAPAGPNPADSAPIGRTAADPRPVVPAPRRPH
ncbi:MULTISPECIES: hypothetical protein [unclassified Nocardiopsis]|uniref:hypothetical protein n=1 Tax=Nocardiopsis TaxID=2013 RepID=UPI00387B13EE